MRLKPFILITLLLLFPYLASGDDGGIRFRIQDAGDKSVISDVICRFFDAEDRIVHYTKSDGNGVAILPKGRNVSYAVFTKMGYEREKVSLSPLYHGEKNILLHPKDHLLQEVVVKAPPITVKKDTIVYNISAFKDQHDRSIGDVLKKLPGLSVSKDGAISYQGKGISKFYIEGQDLLGNRYNQAVQNLPAEAAAQIELLEHHQNIKALEDKIFEDRAALNIRLKQEYRIRLFGYIEAGIGASPFIWNNNLFLSKVSKVHQMMVTTKMNNSGEDLSKETKEQFTFENLEIAEFSPESFLNTRSLTKPPYDQKRYLMNNSYSLGLNNLFKTSDQSNLRINLLGYTDKIEEKDSNHSIFGGNNVLNLKEINTRTNRLQEYTPIINYELNTLRTYITNELRANFSFQKQERSILTNELPSIQKVESKPLYIQNQLKALFSTGKQYYQLLSNIRYYTREESLLGEKYDGEHLSAIYRHKRFGTKNRLITSFPIWNSRLNITVFGNYGKDFYSDRPSDPSVDTTLEESKVGIISSTAISSHDLGNITLTVPVSWNYFLLSNGDNQPSNYLSIEPSLSYYRDFKAKYSLRLTSSYSINNDREQFYSPHLLRTDYRQYYRSMDQLYRSSRISSTVSLHYRNLYSMTFASLLLSHSYVSKPYYRDYQYDEHRTIIQMKEGQNNHHTLLAAASFEKSFIDHGLSLKSELNYNRMQNLLSQSGIQLRNNSNIFTFTLSSMYKKLEWMKVHYAFTGNIIWHENRLNTFKPLRNFNNELKINILPMEQLNIGVRYQNSVNELKAREYKSTHFFDLEASYILNKRVELRGEMNNVFNHDLHIMDSVDGINYHSLKIPLRGREFLVSCLFRF